MPPKKQQRGGLLSGVKAWIKKHPKITAGGLTLLGSVLAHDARQLMGGRRGKTPKVIRRRRR